MMRLGLIAGNGSFPFLVLDAARTLGYDVTVIAVQEEASRDIEAAAARHPARRSIGSRSGTSVGPSRSCGRRASPRRSWRAR